MESIGSRIRKKRISSGLTQKTLGHLCGTSQRNISSFEQDRTSPDIRTLSTIADVLNVSIEYFIYGSESYRDLYKLSDEEASVISRYRLISNDGKKTIQYLLSKDI